MDAVRVLGEVVDKKRYGQKNDGDGCRVAGKGVKVCLGNLVNLRVSPADIPELVHFPGVP